MSSEASLLGAMPPKPTLRRSTSAPISSVIISNRRHASSSRVSSRRPYQRDSLAISRPCARSTTALICPGEEFLQLRPMLWVLPQDSGPARFVGFIAILFAGCAVELDRLDAAVGLTLDVLGILLGKYRHRIRFSLLPGCTQQVALRISQLVPSGFVYQDRHLGRIKAGVDPISRFLMPS